MVAKKRVYMTYEYEYSSDEYGKIIILAYIKEDEGKKKLNISLRTADDMALTHSIYEEKTDNSSEEYIEKQVMKMVDSGEIVNFIKEALEDEYIIEESYENNPAAIVDELLYMVSQPKSKLLN